MVIFLHHYHTTVPALMTTAMLPHFSPNNKVNTYTLLCKDTYAFNLINEPIFTSSLTDFLFTSGNIYVSPFTTTLQTSTRIIVPQQIQDIANGLRTQYMSIATVIKSPTKSRVSFKGKIVKVKHELIYTTFVSHNESYSITNHSHDNCTKNFYSYLSTPCSNITSLSIIYVIYCT